MLVERQERAVECLRYFYGCFPLNQPGARERAQRLHVSIAEQRAELHRIKQALPRDQPQMANLALQRLNPLVDMLSAAVARAEATLQPAGAR